MDEVLQIAGAAVGVLGVVISGLRFYYDYLKKKTAKIQLSNHKLFLYLRQWRHDVRVQRPQNPDEQALNSLVLVLINTLEARCTQLVATKPLPRELVNWHMDTIDVMFKRAGEAHVCEALIYKFQEHIKKYEKCILTAVKNQQSSTQDTAEHLVDDIFKDYSILFGLVFDDYESLLVELT